MAGSSPPSALSAPRNTPLVPKLNLGKKLTAGAPELALPKPYMDIQSPKKEASCCVGSPLSPRRTEISDELFNMYDVDHNGTMEVTTQN